jgi:WD40 repeat protein
VNDSVDRVVGLSVSSDEIHIAVACTMLDEAKQFDVDQPSHDELNPQTHEKMDFYIINLNRVDERGSNPIKPLFPASQHFGIVKDIAISTSKNIIATIGMDRHAKIWAYGEENIGKFSYKFPEMPLCIDIHPMGFQIIVGFKESLKVYYLTHDDFKLAMEQILKGCNVVKYSNGGQYFVMTYGQRQH